MNATRQYGVRTRVRGLTCLALGGAMMVLFAGCRSGGLHTGRRPLGQPIIRHVACVYDQNPWLDLDRLGDHDVEGFWFRLFLDPGSGHGVHAVGTLHVEMYRIDRGSGDTPTERTLVSDWHYPTSELAAIAKPGMLGDGYVPRFVWADKSLAGSEVDVLVWFEDPEGKIARAGTKRLEIPKYER